MGLEDRRKQLELKRVQMACEELEFKVEEKMDEIARIKEHIQIQKQREKELIKQIEENK